MRFRIDLKIFIFLAIFYFTNQIKIYMWTLIFCFIHEIGHLIMGIVLGLRPEKIEMTPFGFFIEFEPNTQKTCKQVAITNIFVAMAGPITNLVIILAILFLHISFLGRDIIVYINLVILLFNLVPIYPLDGGRVLKGILELFYNKIKTDNLINKISNLYMITLTMIGSIAIYYFKNISILMIIVYLWILVIKENKKALIKNKSWELAKKV